MSSFAYIDYKKPIDKRDDMRTSTYRGHVHMNDIMLGNKLHAKFGETKTYHADSSLERKRISDYMDNYVWQYADPFEVRNPSIPKMHSIKPYDECQLRFLKRPMRPATSVSHQDYLWRPEAPLDPPTPLPLPSASKTTHIVINRAKPGYTKYLDPSATTSRLAFVSYTPEELQASVAAKDNITFWNWDAIQHKSKRVYRERDEQMCDKLSAKECPKRRCEFPSLVKHVPHAGLTTEVRENYVEPIKRKLDFEMTRLRNANVHFPFMPSFKDTEYKIIGSGDRTQKFV